MRKSFDDSGIQFVWDATSVSLAATCLRKYKFRMIDSLIPRHNSVHLLFGGVYASSLERFYHLRADGLSLPDALQRTVQFALCETWSHERDESGNRIPGTGQPLSFEHAYKTRENLIRTIVWYIEEFGDEPEDGIKTHHLLNGEPAVELSFCLDFGDDLMYAGHMDRVVNYADGLYWMDQKTTGATPGPYFIQSYSPDYQFTGYSWAGSIILQSPIKGGIVDIAQIAAGFTRFERAFIHRTKDQIDEWREDTYHAIKLARTATREQHFPRNLASCGNYGGCEYRQICALSPKASVRNNFIESNFITGTPWDPATPR